MLLMVPNAIEALRMGEPNNAMPRYHAAMPLQLQVIQIPVRYALPASMRATGCSADETVSAQGRIAMKIEGKWLKL